MVHTSGTRTTHAHSCYSVREHIEKNKDSRNEMWKLCYLVWLHSEQQRLTYGLSVWHFGWFCFSRYLPATASQSQSFVLASHLISFRHFTEQERASTQEELGEYSKF